jgi:hypothetical protein
VFENGVYPQKIARENDDKVYLQKVYPKIGRFENGVYPIQL